MDDKFIIDASLIAVTKNRFGDLSYSSTTALKCWFREVTMQEAQPQAGKEAVRSDAMAWFPPDSGVTEGSVLLILGQYYRVQQVINARRLDDPAVVFIKTTLERFEVIS